MPTELEHVCTCGQAIWNGMLWVVRVGKNGSGYCVQFGYCPDCGCYLDPNGCAYEMVRADRAAALEKELVEAQAMLQIAANEAALDSGGCVDDDPNANPEGQSQWWMDEWRRVVEYLTRADEGSEE